MPTRPKRRIARPEEQKAKPEKARGLMNRMRQRQKLFLVILASALLIPMGAYPIFERLFSPRVREKAGTAYGKPVSVEEFETLRWRMGIIRSLRAWTMRFDAGSHPDDDQVWERYVLLHEARSMGLKPTRDEEDDFLGSFFPTQDGRLDRAQFDRYLQARAATVTEDLIRQAVDDEILVLKLLRAITGPLAVSDDEVWGHYLDTTCEYEVSYVAIPADPYVRAVPAPGEAALKAWYEKYKTLTAEKSEVGVGYFLPVRCRVHYFIARLDDFRKTTVVTEEELRKEYEKNKELYRVTTQPSTQPSPEPSTQPSTRPTTAPVTLPVSRPAGSAAAPAGAPAGAPATGPASPPATAPATTQAAEFKPFEEVQESIRERLLDEKARAAARQASQLAGNRRSNLEAEAAGQIDYAELARQYHMTYVPPTGFITAREAMRLPGLRDAYRPDRQSLWATPESRKTVADLLFGGKDDFGAENMVDPDGNAYHVWRTDYKEPVQRTFEDAREQVRTDLVAFEAYQRAGARARELLDELKHLPATTTRPIAAIAEKGPQLEVRTAVFTLSAADTVTPDLDPLGTDLERERARQALFARTVRKENLGPGASAVAADPIARLHYLLQVTRRAEPVLDQFRQDIARYRMTALYAKQVRLYTEWRKGALEDAGIEKAEKPKIPERPQE